MQALQSRIDWLERELSQYQSPARQASQDVSSEIAPVQAAEVDNFLDPIDDLTNVIGRLNVSEDGQTSYFGPRSNFNLSQHLNRPTDVSVSTNVPVHLVTGISAALQDQLLDIYWTWQNPWNYLVHKARFLQELHSSPGRYCSPLMLHAILSLAARFSDDIELRTDPSDPDTAGCRLAEEAKKLLYHEMETPTVSTVGATMVLSMREMAVDKEAVGWTYAGITLLPLLKA